MRASESSREDAPRGWAARLAMVRRRARLTSGPFCSCYAAAKLTESRAFGGVYMRSELRWAFGLAIATMIVAVPWGRYRYVYAHAKRLHVVSPGVLYRCGQLTEAGFTEAVGRYGIRTVLNVQNEFPDPPIDRGEVVGHPTVD